MGGVSIWHWVVVGVVVMLLFGRGKISELMGDMAKGIKAFKKGMSDDEAPAASVTPTTAPGTTAADGYRSLEQPRHPVAAEPAPSSTLADRKLG